MLWDIRKSQGTLKPEPVIELDGHIGPVTLVYVDPYKIVIGGPEDDHVSVWEVETGTQTNTWVCSSDEEPNSNAGCSAMAVDGCRFVTASCGKEDGLVWFREFTDATCPVSSSSHEDKPSSKFWDPQSYSDTENSDD